jgi:hypothetical protein
MEHDDANAARAVVERLTRDLEVARAMLAERDRLLEGQHEASEVHRAGFAQLIRERDASDSECCRLKERLVASGGQMAELRARAERAESALAEQEEITERPSRVRGRLTPGRTATGEIALWCLALWSGRPDPSEWEYGDGTPFDMGAAVADAHAAFTSLSAVVERLTRERDALLARVAEAKRPCEEVESDTTQPDPLSDTARSRFAEPWPACPTCPSCTSPCGTRDSARIEEPSHLRCMSCGEQWLALPGEVAQALAADAAWELRQQKIGLVREHLTDTVWLVAEAFGADRECVGCQKVVRSMSREHGSVCGLHRTAEGAP